MRRNLCVPTQYEQKVVVRWEIWVGIFIGLMDTCHIVTFNVSVLFFSKWTETFFILVAFVGFDQAKSFSNLVPFLLFVELIKVTLDNIMV